MRVQDPAESKPPAISKAGLLQWLRNCRNASVMVGYLAVGLTGCVEIEFDKMSGTTFPPELVVLGEPVTIEAVYFLAGRLVVVNEDETNIAPLNIADDDCISDAELDALEQGHRSSPLFPDGNTYYLYAATVDHYGEVLDACSPNWITGKLWAGNTRSALAIFYAHSTIAAGSAEYLRTTIHEIGHAFNLHHEDGDGTTTIMNQTGSLNENWTFSFSNESLEHLQQHPEKCRLPGAVGGAPFTWVIADHANSHAGTTVYDCS